MQSSIDARSKCKKHIFGISAMLRYSEQLLNYINCRAFNCQVGSSELPTWLVLLIEWSNEACGTIERRLWFCSLRNWSYHTSHHLNSHNRIETIVNFLSEICNLIKNSRKRTQSTNSPFRQSQKSQNSQKRFNKSNLHIRPIHFNSLRLFHLQFRRISKRDNFISFDDQIVAIFIVNRLDVTTTTTMTTTTATTNTTTTIAAKRFIRIQSSNDATIRTAKLCKRSSRKRLALDTKFSSAIRLAVDTVMVSDQWFKIPSGVLLWFVISDAVKELWEWEGRSGMTSHPKWHLIR